MAKKGTSNPATQQLKKFFTNNSGKVKDWKLLLALVSSDSALSLVDDEYFKDYMKLVGHRSVSRTTVTDYMSLLANTVRERLCELLSYDSKTGAGPKWFGLTFDGWSSRRSEPYFVVTAHYLNEAELKHENLVLAIHEAPGASCLAHLCGSDRCVAFAESHTGAYIADLVSRVIDDFGVKERIAGIVHDNASNCQSAMDILKMPHVNCIAHSLQLVIRAALKVCFSRRCCCRPHLLLLFGSHFKRFWPSCRASRRRSVANFTG